MINMNSKLLSILILFLNFLNLNAFKGECNHLSPYMFNKLSLGVDLTKLNLFPEKDDFFSKNGFKDNLFNQTCYQNRNFQLPNLVIKNENITYYLPDHMQAQFFEQTDHRLVVHRVFEADEDSYKKNMMKLLKINNLSDEENQGIK